MTISGELVRSMVQLRFKYPLVSLYLGNCIIVSVDRCGCIRSTEFIFFVGNLSKLVFISSHYWKTEEIVYILSLENPDAPFCSVCLIFSVWYV